MGHRRGTGARDDRETPALSEEEQEEIIRVSIEEAGGRIPVIANSGCNNTEKTVAKSVKYEKMGADGLLVITPYYNKPNETGMMEHFRSVADSVAIPNIYLQRSRQDRDLHKPGNGSQAGGP